MEAQWLSRAPAGKLPPLVDLTCKQVTELVSDYLTSPGLGTRDRARFEQHLHACTWCMDYLQQLEQGTRAARSLVDEPSAPPEDALLAMFRRLRTDSKPVPASAMQGPAPTQVRTASRRAHAGRRIEGVRFAFKFLMPGAVGPLSSFQWPLPSEDRPGAWVDVGGAVEPCRAGIHACTTRDLSSWLHDTLWLVELDGELRRSVGSVVAARGRLVREIVGWREGGAARFARAAYDHATHRAAAEPPEQRAAAAPCLDAAAYHIPRGSTALAAFCCAMSVARSRGITRFEQGGYDAERRWQSSWIARDLALDVQLREAAAR